MATGLLKKTSHLVKHMAPTTSPTKFWRLGETCKVCLQSRYQSHGQVVWIDSHDIRDWQAISFCGNFMLHSSSGAKISQQTNRSSSSFSDWHKVLHTSRSVFRRKLAGSSAHLFLMNLGSSDHLSFGTGAEKKQHSFTILHFIEPIAKQANLSCKLTRSIKVRRQSISTVCPHASTPFCVRQGGRSIFICDRFDTVLKERSPLQHRHRAARRRRSRRWVSELGSRSWGQPKIHHSQMQMNASGKELTVQILGKQFEKQTKKRGIHRVLQKIIEFLSQSYRTIDNLSTLEARWRQTFRFSWRCISFSILTFGFRFQSQRRSQHSSNLRALTDLGYNSLNVTNMTVQSLFRLFRHPTRNDNEVI